MSYDDVILYRVLLGDPGHSYIEELLITSSKVHTDFSDFTIEIEIQVASLLHINFDTL